MNNDYLRIGEHFPQGNPYLNIKTRKIFCQEICTLDYSMEDKVKYCLSLFGWTGEKRPEAKSIIQDMEHFNYYVFPAAQVFLERFGGVQIKFNVKNSDDVIVPFVSSFVDSFDIDDFCFCEALQIFKNELLVPVIKVEEMMIFLGESGRVHYWNSDFTGILPADLFSVLASMVFLLGTDLWLSTTPEDRQEVLWWDDALMDSIEAQVNRGTYIPYAKKRFAQNGSIPNPMVGKDSFTKWLLTLEKH